MTLPRHGRWLSVGIAIALSRADTAAGDAAAEPLALTKRTYILSAELPKSEKPQWRGGGILLEEKEGKRFLRVLYHGGGSPATEIHVEGARFYGRVDADPEGLVPAFTLDGIITAADRIEGTIVTHDDHGRSYEGTFVMVSEEDYLRRSVEEPEFVRKDLPIACTVEDAATASIDVPATMGVAAAGEAWIEIDGKLALLQMPGCHVTPLGYPRGQTVGEAAPGGVVLSKETELGGDERLEVLMPGAAPQPVSAPPGFDVPRSKPLLSTDGEFVLFQKTLPRNRRQAVAVPVGRGKRLVISLPAFGIGEDAPPAKDDYVILAIDMATREVVLAGSHEKELHVVSLDGRARRQPMRLQEIKAHEDVRVLPGGGWAGWSLYLDDQAIVWELPGRSGTFHPPGGHLLEEVDIDPSGSFVAYVDTWPKPDGARRRALRVIETVRQSVVFATELEAVGPHHGIAFLGPTHLAFLRMAWGTAQTKGWERVEVVELPQR